MAAEVISRLSHHDTGTANGNRQYGSTERQHLLTSRFHSLASAFCDVTHAQKVWKMVVVWTRKAAALLSS